MYRLDSSCSVNVHFVGIASYKYYMHNTLVKATWQLLIAINKSKEHLVGQYDAQPYPTDEQDLYRDAVGKSLSSTPQQGSF